jgi:hypothetical protein
MKIDTTVTLSEDVMAALDKHPSALDPRRFRDFVVVSRQLVLDSNFSSVVFAPIIHAGTNFTARFRWVSSKVFTR